MTIPPFPSQDLAKLVLGYLAEEQLMTAYDEFLQASPYLDALRNEYDRIFMTSLKNILAEYRAVKIYVETCKPFALRKRLFQCANLFDIVKLLVQNVDMNKLNAQEHNVDKMSSNPSLPCNQSISQIEATSLESSVETTALADLPGNTMTKKKSAKVLDREHRNLVSGQETCNEVRQSCCIELSSLNSVPQSVANEGGQNDIEQGTNNILEEDMTKSKKFESVQKIEEFDNILDFVCKNGNENNNRTFPTTDTISDPHQRISTAGTFQDFTTGIYNDNKSNISTSTSPDVNNAQAPLRRSIGNAFVNIGTINRTDLKSKVFNNATSTPHVQMQTIFINGTQAYKHKTQNPLNCNYTKDEIMAMPTIILVPATGSKSSATDSQPIVTMPTKNDVVTATTSCGQSIFKPLVVDVTSNITVPNITCDINEKFKNSDQKLLNEQSLIKTVEMAGHVSVPKENTYSTALKTSTPQGLPPKRKSSSTPRRSSHHSDHISPESIKSKQSISQESQVCSHDSDIEQLPLRWSDDGSQDGKSQDTKLKQAEAANDTDDICKIKEYIETSVAEQPVCTNDGEGSLHIDLIKRGFDVETAKIIERDLLDSPCPKREIISDVVDSGNFEFMTNDPVEENSARTASETSVNLEIVDDDNCDEVEFSTHECNEDTANFFSHEYVDLSYTKKSLPPSLKDNYTMEFCVEDDVTVRLRATTFNMLLDQDFEEMDAGYICKETEIAVSSISNIDKLYTPMKDPKAQVYEIFDSTLTSLDTPLKVATPTSQELEPIVTEIELEVEKVDNKEKVDMKKRKRLQSSYTSDESPNCSKRPKSETQYLLNTANIHNIDIESVLSKLHGP
ncbi:unnamed protein product, partial [Iphiclides podalirius]